MLNEILDSVRAGLPAVTVRAREFEELARAAGPGRSLAAALRVPGLSVIAEIKRRSPSRGVIDSGLVPAELAREYEEGGAAAVSVLTEPDFFGGSLADLAAVRAAIDVPVLRKDFILDPAQIWQARSTGADAVLLIVAALGAGQLAEFLGVCEACGVEALVEVHSPPEVAVALGAGAGLIGVNNRDLSTFNVDLDTAVNLRPDLGDVVAVAESGIWSAGDAVRMRLAGYEAVLVGESLVRSGDPGGEIRTWQVAAGVI